MPRKNNRFTPKEDRMAEHIADSERKSGISAKEARSIGYATVNKRQKNIKKHKEPSVADYRKKRGM